MVQKARKQTTKKRGKQPTARAQTLSRPRNPTFGAVSTINTAPVAIGNSMRGAKAQVIHNSGGDVRVVGRDYAYTAYNSGTVTNWLMVGGLPLNPACFVSSVLRSYTQIYNKFKFNRVTFHYITSSPTSSSGDILFSITRNHTDPIPNWTATTFLPYVLSEPETVIGPQWTNHSISLAPKGPFRTLTGGLNSDIDYQSQGEVFLFSKTSSTDSPGYVLIDYDITFAELAVNPRSGLLPNPNMVYQAIQFTWPTTALTANSTTVSVSTGTTGSGGTALTSLWSQNATHAGDVFKVVLDISNTNSSGWTFSAGSATLSTLFTSVIAGANVPLTLTDGYTCYVVAGATANFRFYSNAAEAFSNINQWVAGATYTPAAYADNNHAPNAGVWLMGFASYVGTINANNMQQS